MSGSEPRASAGDARSTDACESRGTVTIDVERCKGCELCIPACKPNVLMMSSRRNQLGVPYPELIPGCTGCGACMLVCPDFCFEVYQYDSPVVHEASRAGGTSPDAATSESATSKSASSDSASSKPEVRS